MEVEVIERKNPEFENVYHKSVIYQIIPKSFDILFSYVGSTTNYYMRKHLHKSDCQNVASPRYNLEVYELMRQYGGWNSFIVQVIEEFCCNSKRELEKREQYWKEYYGSNIGKRSFADRCQYYKDHREDILKHHRDEYAKDSSKKKQYYQANKDRQRIRAKQYYHTVKKKHN
jgi:hypothetical protein